MQARIQRKSLLAAICAVALTCSGAAVARADTVVGGADATMPAGSTGVASFYLDETDTSDPVNGCNANGSAGRSVKINVTSDSSWLTVDSPGYVTVTDCGPASAASIGYTVASSAVAGQVGTITGTAPAGTSGTPNGRVQTSGCPGRGCTQTDYPTYRPDSFTVTVAAPANPCAGVGSPNAPVWAPDPISGADGQNSWFVTAPTPTASSTTAGAVITYSTDGVTFDTTAPGMLSDGTHTLYAKATDGACADKMSSAVEAIYYVDTLKPTIGHTVSPAGPNGQNGWYVTGPMVAFNCDDATSGIASCVADGETGASKTLGESALAQTVNGTATDNAGWTNSDSISGLMVDLSNPVLNISGASSGVFNVCAAPSRPSFDPTDAISGIASSSDTWSVPSALSGVGVYSYSATAFDNAGRTTTDSRTYTVSYGGAVNPFSQPINGDGTSRFKLGSTVPVKFTITCNGTPLSSAVARLYVVKGDSMADPGVDEAISTSAATSGNLFRYDVTGGQYIFNLSTKTGYLNPGSSTPVSFSTGTWTLKIGLDDGTWRSVNIQLVK